MPRAPHPAPTRPSCAAAARCRAGLGRATTPFCDGTGPKAAVAYRKGTGKVGKKGELGKKGKLGDHSARNKQGKTKVGKVQGKKRATKGSANAGVLATSLEQSSCTPRVVKSSLSQRQWAADAGTAFAVSGA